MRDTSWLGPRWSSVVILLLLTLCCSKSCVVQKLLKAEPNLCYVCVEFFSQIFIFASGAQRVRYIWPRRGSINGGTHVTIVGSGRNWTLIHFVALRMRLKPNSAFSSPLHNNLFLCNEGEQVFFKIFFFYCWGFAQERQFQLNPTDNNFGNRVTFVSSTLSFPCDVERDSTHGGQILCYTR